MKIGLFGGTFDPIHFGHILPVKEARTQLGLDRVIYLPTAIPPHKPGGQIASPHARWTMVELALLAEPGLVADPFELTPEREAFTVESVEHFRSALPDADLYLLIGCDGFVELHTWKRWEDLVAMVKLGVLVRPDRRPGALEAQLTPEVAALMGTDRVCFITNDPVAVSATELRRLLAEGAETPEGWLPDLVLEYIHKYNLYR
jgi:nicotinate-nucleotide adenylyltransferase